MPYVQVEVDLDDLDTGELVVELCRRLRTGAGRKNLNKLEKQELKEAADDIQQALGVTNNGIEVKTLEDKMKVDHIANIFHKYNLSDIEKLLP